jgi:hypothetical protein
LKDFKSDIRPFQRCAGLETERGKKDGADPSHGRAPPQGKFIISTCKLDVYQDNNGTNVVFRNVHKILKKGNQATLTSAHE